MADELQRSIVITLSQRTIKERKGGFRKILKEWMNKESTWWYRMGNSPKRPENIEWVYWCIGGRIRYKCRLLEVHKDKHVTFSDNRSMYGKRWLVFFDFEFIPKELQREKRGFQGFRYM